MTSEEKDNNILSTNEKKKESSHKRCLQLFRLVKIIAKQHDQIQRFVLKEENITLPQHRILQLLWKKDGLQSKDLAEATKSSRSTITGVVDTLEKNGFVIRELNVNDRRSWLVKLTEKGKDFRTYTPEMDLNVFCPDVEIKKVDQLIKLLQEYSDKIIIPEVEDKK